MGTKHSLPLSLARPSFAPHPLAMTLSASVAEPNESSYTTAASSIAAEGMAGQFAKNAVAR